MSQLIRNVKVVDPNSSFGGKNVDLLLVAGRVEEIREAGNIHSQSASAIEEKGLCVAPGWVDVMADYCDPGYEHKESVESGLAAAAAGGFTDVFVVPNTQPVIGNKAAVEYLASRAKGNKANLYALGAVSKLAEGKELAEMLDMRAAGAVAFSDGWHPVQNAGLLLKALEYVKAFDGVIIQLPILSSLANGGLMNESETSVRLGMSGIPAIAESLLVQRDIELVRYTGSKIHFSGISTEASLNLVRAAKADGLQVTCSVTPYHLLFTEENLQQYDSLYKVAPPLRNEQERLNLVAALADGTIDCIATHHRPQDWDAKVKEFEYAQYGMAMQEVCFAALLQAAPDVTLERWVALLSTNARKIFNLEKISLEQGAAISNFTFFSPETVWVPGVGVKQTKAYNLPFMGQPLKGKAFVL
ncbi:MAG: dihydroorotase [Edaphocola sp.]